MNRENIIKLIIDLTIDKYAIAGSRYNEYGSREIAGTDIEQLKDELIERLSEVLKHE